MNILAKLSLVGPLLLIAAETSACIIDPYEMILLRLESGEIEAPLIFRGTAIREVFGQQRCAGVDECSYPGTYRTFEYAVSEIWRGTPGRKVVVPNFESSSCSRPVHVGEEYVVVVRPGMNGFHETHGSAVPIGSAHKIVKLLRSSHAQDGT